MASARIAVVTRTKDRAWLLDRALAGLAAQDEKDFVWIVVNDGGERAGPEAAAEKARAAGMTVKLIHNDVSRDRPGAANVGVRAADADYVLLHDDDDQIHASFLRRAAAFLDERPDLVGVATHIMRIDEAWEGSPPQAREIRRYVFEPDLDQIYLIDMVQRNRFAPIGFLYRKSAYDAVGGYDEELPVLEDWDFNLRLLLRGDIGVIAEPLAYYFIRTNVADQGDPAANTVHAMTGAHWEHDAMLRNRYLRRDLETGRFGLGALAAMTRLVDPSHRMEASWERFKGAFDVLGARSLWRRLNRRG